MCETRPSKRKGPLQRLRGLRLFGETIEEENATEPTLNESMEHDVETEREEIVAKGGAIGWQNVALAFASILFALVGFLELNFWQRLTGVEATINARGERIAILEAQAHQDRADIQKIADTLDRFNNTLADMKSDHRQFQLMLDKLRK